jgi:hypothetical protein
LFCIGQICHQIANQKAVGGQFVLTVVGDPDFILVDKDPDPFQRVAHARRLP